MKKTKDDASELMTVREVAQYLKVHPNTLRRWDSAGIVRAYRIGRGTGHRRYRRADVERLLQ